MYDFLSTLPFPMPDEKKKLTQLFILIFLCGASKGFIKAFKAFIKPYETPQRSVKIKININFLNVRDGKD